MSMNRIKPLEIPIEQEIQGLMNRIFPKNIPSPNLYRIVAKNKNLFQYLIETKFLGKTGLYDSGRIKPDLREKIILRTCVCSKNRYEYLLHVKTISLKMGLNPKQLKDILRDTPSKDLWSSSEITLFELIDTLVKDIHVSNELFDKVKTYYKESEIIEIIMLIGFYTMVAMLVEVARPEPDDYGK